MDNMITNTGTKRGGDRVGTAAHLVSRQIPLNEQAIFRTIEGNYALLHVIGPGPEILL